MARFGQGLIQALTNPAYADKLGMAGMMAGSLPGRLRDEREAKLKEEQQRKAQQSLFSILNAGDANDPNVAASAQAVGAQMGQDPAEVQKMINEARTMGINQEKLKVQKDRLEIEQANAALEQERREEAAENQQIAAGIETAIANGVDPEQALMKLPPDKREFGRAYLEKMSEYQTKIDELKDKARSNERFDDATLAEIQEVVGESGENLIRLYKATHRPETGLSSNKRLLDLADAAYKEQAKKEATIETKPENPTNGERAAAEVAVRQALGRLPRRLPFTGREEEIRIRTAVEERYASLLRTNPDKTPTDAEVKAIYEEIKNQSGNQEAAGTGVRPPVSSAAEGSIATNPATGERYVRRNGQWHPA